MKVQDDAEAVSPPVSAVLPLALRIRQSVTAMRWIEAGLAGVGGFLTILALAEASLMLGTVLLIAPFGASCVLVFALPTSPLDQPRNVIGGHLISAAIGLTVLSLLGPSPVALALGVGLAIAAMALTRTLHPPAGADPIVVIMAGASWSFLLAPVLVGTVAIVLIAALFRHWTVR